MSRRLFRSIRVLQILICGFFLVLATSIYLAPKASKGFAIGLYVFTAISALLFEWRAHGLRRSIARVTAELELIRTKDLESPTAVAERERGELEAEVASNPTFAHLMSVRAVRLFVKGDWKGQRVDIGTAIIANRDFDTMVSHVLVETPHVASSFRVMTKGTLTKLARMGMPTNPTTTGDPSFDEGWVVDADRELASFVLDAGTRMELIELQQRVPWMAVASIEATRFGLVIRWPGELSAETAAYFRDLAIRVSDRLTRASRPSGGLLRSA